MFLMNEIKDIDCVSDLTYQAVIGIPFKWWAGLHRHVAEAEIECFWGGWKQNASDCLTL
jgi:hypothetical protein